MPTAMIVDDSTMMRKNIKLMLEHSGYRVTAEASNGKNIVLNYEQQKPDIITLDLDMPEIDGLTALETLITVHPEAKVIVISAQGHAEKVVKAIQLGAKSYLVKPVDINKLEEVLSKILK